MASASGKYLPGLFGRPSVQDNEKSAEGTQQILRSHTKISIVGGGGAVGLACAYSILNQVSTTETATVLFSFNFLPTLSYLFDVTGSMF